MQQTLFAIMALAVTLLLSFNQLRGHSQSYTKLIDDELEVMGSGVARRILETSKILSFDERTTPASWVANGGAEPAVFEFQADTDFGNIPACDLDEPAKNLVGCDDIDDLDTGNTWQAVPFYFPNGDSLMFEAKVKVQYVADTDLDTPLSSGLKSEYKLLVVKLRSRLHVEQGRYTDGFIELKRVFNYNRALAAERSAASP